MKSTILLCFDALLQSFGFQSNSKDRDTSELPTKSMVIGMLLNALGHDKYVPSQEGDADYWSTALRFAVRDESQNNKRYNYFYDFQTSKVEKETNSKIKNKKFLLDKKFLVLLEGETEDIFKIFKAFACPKRQLYFGRKECCLQHSLFDYINDSKNNIESPIFLNKKIEDIMFDEKIDLYNDYDKKSIFERNHMIEIENFENYSEEIIKKVKEYKEQHSEQEIYLKKNIQKGTVLKKVYPSEYNNFLYYKVVVNFPKCVENSLSL